MRAIKIINIASGALGLIGALALYKGSFAFEQSAGYDTMGTINNRTARNRRRLWFQRAGLALVAASFALQIAAQFVE